MEDSIQKPQFSAPPLFHCYHPAGSVLEQLIRVQLVSLHARGGCLSGLHP